LPSPMPLSSWDNSLHRCLKFGVHYSHPALEFRVDVVETLEIAKIAV
jgi:hypothetical protein